MIICDIIVINNQQTGDSVRKLSMIGTKYIHLSDIQTTRGHDIIGKI